MPVSWEIPVLEDIKVLSDTLQTKMTPEDIILNTYRSFLSAMPESQEAITSRNLLHGAKDRFIESLFWIVNKSLRKQRLILNDGQQKLSKLIAQQQNENRPVRIIILKPRQIGFSTYIAAHIFFQVLTTHHVRSVIMAHQREAGAVPLFRIYKRFYDNLPSNIRLEQGIGHRYGRRLNFEQLDSSLEVLVANEAGTDVEGTTGRASTYHHLHLSEYAFWRNADATMNALVQTVPDHEDTSILIESTAKAYGDAFHQEWERANEGKSDYAPFFIGWFEHSEYQRAFDSEEEKERFGNHLGESADEPYGNEVLIQELHDLTLEQLNWRRAQIRKNKMVISTFEREYPATADEAFAQAGGNFLNRTIMQIHLKNVREPDMSGYFKESPYFYVKPEFVKSRQDAIVHLWCPPEPYADYIIGTDTAEGLESGDFSVALVMRRLPLTVVARLRGQENVPLSLSRFAEQLVWLAKYYNDAWVLPENNFGIAVIDYIVHQANYTRVLKERDVRIGDTPMSKHPDKLGWHALQRTRRYMQSLVKEYFEEDPEDLECPDELLLTEAMDLKMDERGNARAPKKGMSRRAGEASRGFCDDCFIALGSALLAHQSLHDPKPTSEVKVIAELREKLRHDKEFEQRLNVRRNTAWHEWV